MSLNSKMGRKHEEYLAEVFDTERTRGSGNQWRGQMDGRKNRLTSRFAFAWDGKSTLAKSLSIPRKMWEKAREQAAGERPMLALRFYDNERLDVGEDLVVVGLNDFVEMLETANAVPEPQETPILVFLTTVTPKDDSPRVTPFRIEPAKPIIVVRDGLVTRPTEITVESRLYMAYRIKIDGVEERRPVDIYVDNVLKWSAMTNLVGEVTF